MDTTQDINTVEWFFGYGGNHLGLKRVLPNLRLLAACEIEEFAVENILAKMEAGLLEAAPIWSDCKTFPWEPFVDRTHLFVASYPCQPFSAAGKRQGAEDDRHLWPYVYRWILRARPLLVFLENVEGHVSLGLSTVISDLEEGGYKATWGIFSASEVGAPHQRKRVFILAHNVSAGREGRLPEWAHPQWQGVDGHAGCCGAGASGDWTSWPSRPGEQQFAWEPPRVVSGLANSTSAGSGSKGGDVVHQGWSSSDAWATSVSQDAEWQAGAAIADDQSAGGDGAELGNAIMHGHASAALARGFGASEDQGRLQEFAGGSGNLADAECELRPRRPERIGWWIGQSGEVERDVAGIGSEGNGLRQTQPPLGRDADGPADWLDHAELYTTCDNRTDELRLLGNGVVPACAERAFRLLVGELMEDAQ